MNREFLSGVNTATGISGVGKVVFWIILFFFFSQKLLLGQIILTEVMFDADTLEYHNEFVEIYNTGTQPVNLEGWKIGDADELDNLKETGMGLVLNPEQYAVILDASYFGSSTTYDSLIPPEALILTIDDKSFGKSGWSNSTSEPVILTSNTGDTVQIYYYSLDNKPGYSDEKIFLTSENSPQNWSNSLQLRGTPGGKNSVAPQDFDLAIDSVWIKPEYPVENSEITTFIRIVNLGQNTVDEFSVEIFDDVNENQVLDNQEIIVDELVPDDIEWMDTLNYEIKLSGLNTGYHTLGVLIEHIQDQNLTNNLAFIKIQIEALHLPVVINEILFKPESGFPEWIELYNVSDQEINLSLWKIADARDTAVFPCSEKAIKAGEYLVVGKDTTLMLKYGIEEDKTLIIPSFPSLNNDADQVTLFSASGRIVDHVSYFDSWMRRETLPGTSLERINPEVSSQISENWAACVDPAGCTPGRKNSVFVEKLIEKAALSVSPNPFSPDGDDFEDVAFINYQLPVSPAFITVDVFDIMGRRIRRIADKLPVAQKGTIIWDGRDENGRMSRIGLYIIFVQVFESNNDFFKELKTTVVLTKQ